MMLGKITVQDLTNQLEGLPGSASIDYWLAKSHAQRIKAVNKAIDVACNLLVQSKNKKQGKDEDEISIDICNMMRMAGFQAEHDLYVNGHCDIVIKGKDEFLWLAEAKKHDAYAWLEKGYQQLATRYSTGLPGQDHGAILVYCYVQNAKVMLDTWCDRLCDANPGIAVEDPNDGDPLHFISTHQHCSSGLPFCVRHKVVPLYWDPMD